MPEALIPRIYDAALEPEAWPDLLRDPGSAFQARTFPSEESIAGLGLVENWSHGFDRNLYESTPRDIWRPDGSRSIRNLAAARLTRPFDRRACMPDDEIGLDSIGRHFFGRELFHIVLSTLQRGDGALSVIMVGGPISSQAFDTDEMARIGALTEHLGRAMALPYTIDVMPALGDGPSEIAPLARC